MRKFFLSLFFFITAVVGFSQVTVSPHSRLMFQKSSFGFVSELPPAPAKTLGSTYYVDQYLDADLFLKDESKLEGVKVKLDLKTYNIEILHKGEAKILPGDRVLSLQWTNAAGEREVFVRSTHFTTEGLALTGFLKLVSDTEPFTLVEHFTVEILSANYNAALDVGSKDNQIIKKVKSYIAKDNLLLEVKGGRKKFVNDFKETFQTDVSTIVKEFDIDPKDEDELIVLLKQLNFANPG